MATTYGSRESVSPCLQKKLGEQPTFRPCLVLDHNARSSGVCEAITVSMRETTNLGILVNIPRDCPSYVHGTAVASISVDHNRHVRLPSDLLDLPCNFLEGDISGIGQAHSRRHSITCQEYHGKACFFAEPGAECIVAHDMCYYLVGVFMGLEHHGAEAGGLK